MGRLGQFFDFTKGQLRIVLILCATSLLMGLYLLLRTYGNPGPEPVNFPVFLAESDRIVTGVFVLDPNTAPADSLELLPGVGRVIADRIVEYRRHHRFESEIEITRVRGIGPVIYERMRPYLKVRQP